MVMFRRAERVARAGVPATYPAEAPELSEWPPQVPPGQGVPGSPPPARVCPDCGKWHSSDQPLCAACRLKALQAKEPKPHPSRYPCCVCGQSHSHGWAELARTVAPNRSERLPLCQECDPIVHRISTMDGLHGSALSQFHPEFSSHLAPVFRELRDFPAENGRDIEETWLDVRAGRLLGVSECWRDGSPEKILHGLTRYLQRMDQHGPRRPVIACERPNFGPVEAEIAPLSWIALNPARASRYRGDQRSRVRLVPAPPGHPGTGTHPAPADASTVDWAHLIVGLARERSWTVEQAAEEIELDDVGLRVRPSPSTREAALALIAAGPLPHRVPRR